MAQTATKPNTGEKVILINGKWISFNEDDFQRWYGQVSRETGINTNPDAPEHNYDYRSAYVSGANPLNDPESHWPSEFKGPKHPDRYVDGIDTITGEPAKTATNTKTGERVYLHEGLKQWLPLESKDNDSMIGRLGGQAIEGTKDVIRNQATGTLQMDAAATERAITSSERRQRELQKLRSKIEGRPAEEPIKMYTDREHLDSVNRMQNTLNNVEWLKANPKYLESEGFLEDVARLGPQVISQMIVAATTAGAGNVPFMGTQIIGSSYENYVKRGDSPTRARSAAMANAIMQAPLESIGLSKTMKFIKLRGAVFSKLKKFGEALGTEWLTEFLQAYPEAMTSIWSENADKSVLDSISETLDKRWEIAKQGAYEGLVTLPFTAFGIAVGSIANRSGSKTKKTAPKDARIEKGFTPAFRNRKTGDVVESKDRHDLNVLPESDVKKENDKIVAFSQDWIPGYQKEGEFLTPREAEMAIRPKPKAQQDLEKEWDAWIEQVNKEAAAEPSPGPSAVTPERMTPEQRQAAINRAFPEPRAVTGDVPGHGVDARQQGAEMARHMGIAQPSNVPRLGYQNFELVGEPYVEPTNKIPYELRQAVEVMRRQVAEGNAKNYDSEGHPMGSTYPEWFKMVPKRKQKPGIKKGGWSRKEFDRILELAETGQQMTEKQAERFNELLGVAQETLSTDQDLIYQNDIDEEVDMMQKRGFTPVYQRMAAGRINEGDQIVVKDSSGNPDVVTHTGYDDKGNAIFKDGTTIKADPFDQIDVSGIKKIDPEGAAMAAGIEFTGIQEPMAGMTAPRLYLFKDPASGTTVAVSDLDQLPQKLAESRETFKGKGVIELEYDSAIERVKDALKSEKGSWTFNKVEHPITNDLLTIGKHIYNKGVTKLSDFIHQLKNVLGDEFKYVARYSKRLLDSSKFAVDKLKDQAGEVRLGGNTPSERAANEAVNNVRMVNAADMRRMLDEGPSLLEQAKELVDSGIYDTDMKLFHRAFLTPYFLKKRYPSMSMAVDTEIDGRERRTELLNSWYDQPLEDAHLHIPKDKQKMQGLRDLIWKWDNKRFPETEVPDSPLNPGANDRYEIKSSHYDQARQFLQNEGVDPDVLDAFLAIRKTLDKVFVDHVNEAMANIEDKNELQQMRSAVGKIHNYFPHRRYGNTAIKILNKDGDVVYRRHYNRFNRLKNRQTQVNRQAQEWLEGAIESGELDGSVSDYRITRPKKVQAMPDEIFYQIPVDAMEQLIKATAGKVGDETGVDPAAFKKSLSRAVADTFKARGWAEHTIKRRHVAGQDKDDIFGILFDYLSGYAGFKTKVERTKQHHENLRSIDSKNNPNEYRKVAQYVRDMLANTDNVDRVVDKVRGMFFMKYLGAVPKSALVNLTQNIVAAAPVLSMHTKAPTAVLSKAMFDVRKAMTSYNAWTNKGVEYPGLSADEQAAIKYLVESGAANDIFLKELIGNLPGKNRIIKKIVDVSGRMMQVAERFNRTSTGLAGYRVGRKNGMNHKEAVEFAKEVIYDSHFLYGKANLPEFARGGSFRKALRSTYTFRSFTHNYLNLLHHLATNQGIDGKLAMLRSLRNLALVGGVPSLPFFKFLSDMIMKLLGKDDKDLMTEVRRKLPHRWERDLVTYGIPGLFGSDFSGSLSIEAPRNWQDIIGVPYSAFDDTKNMLDSWESGQKYRAISETPVTPIMVRNAMRGLELYYKGQRTRSGRDINEPERPGPRKITGIQAAQKIAGIQPTSVSKGYSAYEAQGKVEDLVDRKTKEFADRFVNAYRSKNRKAMQRVMRELNLWNKNATKAGESHKVIDISSAVESRLEPGVKSIPTRQRANAVNIYKQWR